MGMYNLGSCLFLLLCFLREGWQWLARSAARTMSDSLTAALMLIWKCEVVLPARPKKAIDNG